MSAPILNNSLGHAAGAGETKTSGVSSFSGIEALKEMVIPSLVSAGRYQVRFAQTQQEVEAAQSLRYSVFFQEKQGSPNDQMMTLERDLDEWDDGGFHIIVIDTSVTDQPAVAGTLRLFYSEMLKPGQHFYTEEAFDVSRIKQHYGKSLELSRFCIDPNGRGGAILMLIWKYAMSFIQSNHIPVMLGCASFPGTDVQEHTPIFNYLYEHHLADESLRPSPKVNEYVDLSNLYQPSESIGDTQKLIPTLLKGYLKLGAKISDAAIIDHAFNTVYVPIYVDTQHMLKENPSLVTNA